MKSEIKEIRTISGEVVDFLGCMDDHTPIEIFYRDGSRELNCTPFPLKEPVRFIPIELLLCIKHGETKIRKSGSL